MQNDNTFKSETKWLRNMVDGRKFELSFLKIYIYNRMYDCWLNYFIFTHRNVF